MDDHKLMSDHLRRMLAEARARRSDAELLDGSLDKSSDSSEIIKVLVLEVLLKAALYANGIRWQGTKGYGGGHDYSALWTKLPSDVKSHVLSYACDRLSGNTDFTDIESLLKDLSSVFMRARYYYELYEGKTLEEQRVEGDAWVACGRPMSEAKVRYHPLELLCLIEGLETYLESKLAEFQQTTP